MRKRKTIGRVAKNYKINKGLIKLEIKQSIKHTLNRGSVN